MRRFFPDAAQRAKVGGDVRMKCKVTAEGTLEKCEVLSEVPEGYGFGKAALAMAGLFKMRPMTRDGQPVGGAVVIIPLRFQLPNAPRAPPHPSDPPAP